MTAYEDSAFMVDLLMGTDYASVFKGDFKEETEKQRAENIRELCSIVDRLRAQTIHIVASYRRWQRRCSEAAHPLERRYLAYEGLLCKQDLKQHWLLYRQAVAELHRVAREGRAPQFKHRRPLTGKKAVRKRSSKAA